MESVSNHLGNSSLLSVSQKRNLTSSVNPEEWLEQEISKAKEALMSDPFIPMKEDGKQYELNDLFDDQKYIAFRVLETIHKWLTCKDWSNFEPLRCTINGQGGTGKSVLLNTLVSVLRRFSSSNNVVFAAAPTGTAAFNVNGQTIHSLTGQGCDEEELNISLAKRNDLKEIFINTLMLIIDERSMLSTRLLSRTEQIISSVVFNGRSSPKVSWGGIPVVIIAGDDFQLGSFTQGAHDIIGKDARAPRSSENIHGRILFKELAEVVFQLPTIRRMDKSRQRDMELLGRLRTGERVKDEDVEKLQSLHLDKIEAQHGKQKRTEIEENGIFLFFTNAKRIQHNLTMLSRTNTNDNPTAICKPKSTSSKFPKAIASHFYGRGKNNKQGAALLCKRCRVCIRGRNFFPLWGLHNGACGIVEEIVFAKGSSPNKGDLPIYVIVNFPLYRGPPWDKDNPTCIPIPPVTIRCRKQCCQRAFIPLDLSFARTIHTFQGLQAGPTPKGQQRQHMYEHVICDPDDKSVEATHTGLLYTAVSRGTTLGDSNGLNSAVYFIGPHLTKERIQELTKCKNKKDETYLKVKKRKIWVRHLKSKTEPPKKIGKKHMKLLNFFNTHYTTQARLETRCLEYTQQ